MLKKVWWYPARNSFLISLFPQRSAWIKWFGFDKWDKFASQGLSKLNSAQKHMHIYLNSVSKSTGCRNSTERDVFRSEIFQFWIVWGYGHKTSFTCPSVLTLQQDQSQIKKFRRLFLLSQSAPQKATDGPFLYKGKISRAHTVQQHHLGRW